MGTRSQWKVYRLASSLALLVAVAALVAIPSIAHAAELEIAIDKSVYVGHDGGAGCPGANTAEAELGSDLTYCFVVTNTGTDPLAAAAVGDPALGITSADMALLSGDPALLASGDMVVWAYETTLDGDLVNTATVGAFPVGPSGGPSYDDNPVIASDTAEVSVGGPSQPLAPGISIDKTVYEGHDGGASCPGAETVSLAEGAALTFCFRVANTGETYLADVTIDDAILGITQDQMTVASGSLALMAPGAVTDLYYETTAGGLDYINTAIATGTPSDEGGEELPDTTPPLDEDDASVEIEDESVTPPAAIVIEKRVYAGHDGGASCPGDDTITVDPGSDVTYCFEVTNTGEAYLANVTIDDETLGITDADMTLVSGDPALLAPGATVVWYYETTADQDLVNVATSTGTPSDESGEEFPDVPKPSDEDDASVDVEDEVVYPAADIDIVKLVYPQHDQGTGCTEAVDGEPAVDFVGTPITYCFVVTNTGDAHLANVTIDDETLGITDADMTLLSGDPALLAPGDTIVWYYETTITGTLTNVATTTGIPSNPDGTPIPVEQPSDSDDAVVDILDTLPEDFEVDIDIEKTVYEGHNGGAGCAGAGESVYRPIGTEITYCFEVTNTGNVHLANVTIDDETLGITDADMTLLSGNPALLAPDATVVWYYETTITDNLVNIATTTGIPSNPDGTPIPAAPPTASDDAEVGEQDVLDEHLPNTGVDAAVIAWFGAVLLAAGAVAVGTDRRRRAAVASVASSLLTTPRLWSGGHSIAPSPDRATARRRRLRR